jgi:phage terminase large subunit-like protein
MHKTATRIAQGLESNPHFLPVIFEAEVTDDWEDPKVWKKANPNFGVSVNEKYFLKEVAKVRNNPKLLARFLRLHLNVKTAVETAWITAKDWGKTDPEYKGEDLLTVERIKELIEERPEWFPICTTSLWESSSVDILLGENRNYYTWFFRKVDELVDAPYYAAYDNTAVKDIGSLCLFFPETGDVLTFNFVPAETIEWRSKQDNVPYDIWQKQGLVFNTPLETIDEEQVVTLMVGGEEEGVLFHFNNCLMVVFDRWGTNFIYKKLDDAGITCKAYPQSFVGMNGPCKKLEEMISSMSIFTGGNPVLRWMIQNVMVHHDAQERMRPDKKKSTDKIDGIVALLMAIGAWLTEEDETINELDLNDA